MGPEGGFGTPSPGNFPKPMGTELLVALPALWLGGNLVLGVTVAMRGARRPLPFAAL